MLIGKTLLSRLLISLGVATVLIGVGGRYAYLQWQEIPINPNYTDAYNNRGNARYYLGEYQASIEDYTEAIRINPTDADAYNKRGNARYYLGEYQAAIEDYNQAIRINPNDAAAYNNRGIARDDLGEY
ncbi:MAG: tetratricopeptide repeat protein, partial [Xenococcaceae cyanobacterium]